MDVVAAVMTGPEAGAIATVGLLGESAPLVLRKIFQPVGTGDVHFEIGRILLGHIVDGSEPIDQVTVGCEGPGAFAIHCHGNPLIVETIMKLLLRHGLELLPARQWHVRRLAAEKSESAIAIEARLALTIVKTIEGARIIAGQVEGGLGRLCRQWQGTSMSLDRIKERAGQVLSDSVAARLMIAGATIVLIGPPNTGKSTLLNTLAGREKAIVTDVEGTTRDWISAEIHIPPLAATVIDTAGLAADLAHGIDRAAQNRSIEMLRQADLILLVLDSSQPDSRLEPSLLDLLAAKDIVPVLNKADLPERLDPAALPPAFHDPIRISARQNTGIDALIAAIHRTLGVEAFDPPHTPAAFTDRQRALLERLTVAASPEEIATLSGEILEGPVDG